LSTISLAHSPDADDIFMYYAISFGWVSQNGLKFKNSALDIETLNQDALKGTFDATAISFALYPFIQNSYALLKTAVSFGEGYGPKLIRLKNKRLKRNFKVALSGKYTTNAMLFRIAYPEARITYLNFLEIEQAVLDEKVDAGVLIHESILDFNENLTVEAELWDIWQKLAGDSLPLPLGGMAIRRSLPLSRAIAIEDTLTDAVKVATEHKELLSNMLLERNLVRIDADALNKYLNLYANEQSVTLNDTQYEAINRLYSLGHEHGFYEHAIDARNFTIPQHYNSLRNS